MPPLQVTALLTTVKTETLRLRHCELRSVGIWTTYHKMVRNLPQWDRWEKVAGPRPTVGWLKPEERPRARALCLRHTLSEA